MKLNFSIAYSTKHGISPSTKSVVGELIYESWLPTYVGYDGSQNCDNMIFVTSEEGSYCNDSNVYGFILPTNALSGVRYSGGEQRYCTLTLTTFATPEALANGYDVTKIPIYAIDKSFNILEEYPKTWLDWINAGIPGVEGDAPNFDGESSWLSFETTLMINDESNLYVYEATGPSAIAMADMLHNRIGTQAHYTVSEPWPASNPIYTLINEDLPIIKAPGYTFKGWTLNGEFVTAGMVITDDITLIAEWTENPVVGVDGGSTGQLLQFLYGQNFNNKNIPFKPGTFYLDVNSGELWIDDPTENNLQHNKIIDTDTLVYAIDNSMIFPIENNTATAKLGVSYLGTMRLGASS